MNWARLNRAMNRKLSWAELPDDLKRRLRKATLMFGAFVLVVVTAVGCWLWNGGERPLRHQVVQLQAGNSGADYSTGVEVRLSDALRRHPFASTFKVKADFAAGSGGYNRTVIYDRRRNTIHDSLFSYGAHENAREMEYLYRGLTDASIHALSGGRLLGEFEFADLGVQRQVISEKRINAATQALSLPPSHPARQSLEIERQKQKKR